MLTQLGKNSHIKTAKNYSQQNNAVRIVNNKKSMGINKYLMYIKLTS